MRGGKRASAFRGASACGGIRLRSPQRWRTARRSAREPRGRGDHGRGGLGYRRPYLYSASSSYYELAHPSSARHPGAGDLGHARPHWRPARAGVLVSFIFRRLAPSFDGRPFGAALCPDFGAHVAAYGNPDGFRFLVHGNDLGLSPYNDLPLSLQCSLRLCVVVAVKNG